MQVIKLLNNYQILLDAGTLEGIETGMKISIYEKGEKIELPTKTISIDKLKKTLVVTHAEEEYSILEHPKSYTEWKKVSIGSLENISTVTETFFGRGEEVIHDYSEEDMKLFETEGDEKLELKSIEKIKVGDIAKIS